MKGGAIVTTAFYTFIVVMAVLLLAAVQLRSSGGAAFDTWRLNYAANRSLNDELTEKIHTAADNTKSDANSATSNEVCLRLFDSKTGILQKSMVDEETASAVTLARQQGTPADSFTGDVFCLLKGYTQIEVDFKYFNTRAPEHAAESSRLNDLSNSNNIQYADLVKGHQDFMAFHEMEKLPVQRLFVVAPYDLLVLLLVMLMGGLGGMVRLLRDYGAADHTSPTAEEYLLVPLVGAVVAIGGYVLAKCGLLLLSSAGTESSLSPFMVSLVGIVSGLLAKEVIDTIAVRGRKMLSGDDGTPPH